MRSHLAGLSLDALILPKDETGKERLCIAAPLPEEGGPRDRGVGFGLISCPD